MLNAYPFFSSLAFSSAAFLLSERLLRNRLKDSLSDFLKLFLLEMGVSDVPVKSLKTKKNKKNKYSDEIFFFCHLEGSKTTNFTHRLDLVCTLMSLLSFVHNQTSQIHELFQLLL